MVKKINRLRIAQRTLRVLALLSSRRCLNLSQDIIILRDLWLTVGRNIYMMVMNDRLLQS